MPSGAWVTAIQYDFKCHCDTTWSKTRNLGFKYPKTKKEGGKYSRRNGALKGCISEIP